MPSTTLWTGREIPRVQISTVSLSEKGLGLLLIDHELSSNEKSLERLMIKKAAILRELRACDSQINSYLIRQETLQRQAVALQTIPDKFTY